MNAERSPTRPARRIPLSQLARALQGIVPYLITTASSDGTPNVTYLSHVQYIDERHIALSRQFFNKTQQNLAQNPLVSVFVNDPLDFAAYHLQARLLCTETAGPLFDTMAARIDTIALHTGMRGTFRLIAADICEVLSIEQLDDFLDDPVAADEPVLTPEFQRGPMTELRGLQVVSDRINRASDLETLLASTLAAFAELLGLDHSIVLHADEENERLVTTASHGYGSSGVGAEVKIGAGLIGNAALTRQPLLLTDMLNDLRYGRTVRGRHEEESGQAGLRPEVPLPGLPDANSQLALPLLLEDELLGVLVFERQARTGFESWQVPFLQLLANQLAMGWGRLRRDDEDAPPATPAAAASPAARTVEPATSPAAAPRKHSFVFYRNDDAVFVDGEYLVRNVPGRILWKVLTEHARQARSQFTNRELRLDPRLGLPALKDNLESRLLVLRKRLSEKCPEVRLVPTQRGRFALELDCPVELTERDHA